LRDFVSLAMAGNHRFCARCQYKHASPTGKKCRRPILEPVADPAPEGAVGGDLPEQPEMLEFPEVAVGNNNINDDRFDTLLSVVSDLASRVDATQRRLDALHLTASSPPQSASAGAVAPSPSSGAVPKCPACASGYGCAASAGVHGNMPHLQNLRADTRAMAQANSMVDSMETAIPGNDARALRQGWSRPGGDNAPGWPYHGHRTS
jgi:hypothetical protein